MGLGDWHFNWHAYKNARKTFYLHNECTLMPVHAFPACVFETRPALPWGDGKGPGIFIYLYICVCSSLSSYHFLLMLGHCKLLPKCCYCREIQKVKASEFQFFDVAPSSYRTEEDSLFYSLKPE